MSRAQSQAGSLAKRDADLRRIQVAGERLLEDLEALGLSLAAAYVSMSLDILAREDRGASM